MGILSRKDARDYFHQQALSVYRDNTYALVDFLTFMLGETIQGKYQQSLNRQVFFIFEQTLFTVRFDSAKDRIAIVVESNMLSEADIWFQFAYNGADLRIVPLRPVLELTSIMEVSDK